MLPQHGSQTWRDDSTKTRRAQERTDDRIMCRRHKIIWGGWLLGTALVFLSWIDVVDARIGWAGFSIAAIASILSRVPEREVSTEPGVNYTPDQIREFVADFTRRLDAGEESRAELLLSRGAWRMQLSERREDECREAVADLSEAMRLNPGIEFDARYWRGLAFDGLREDSQVASVLSVCIEHARGEPSQRERLEIALHHRCGRASNVKLVG